MNIFKSLFSTKMIDDCIVQNLSKVQLFENLSLNDLEELSLEIKELHYSANEIIFKENDEADGMYILIEGGVNIIKEAGSSKELVVDTLGNNSYFGEMSLIDNQKRSASVRCVTDTSVYFLDRNNFNRMLKKNKNTTVKILFNLCRTLSRRLKSTTGKLIAS